MSDTTDTTTTTAEEPQGTDTTSAEPQGSDTDWKAEARKWEERAKKNEAKAKEHATAAKELEQLRQQSMTDAEKAIEHARTEARQQALAEAGGKVAAAEIRAAAAGRLEAAQVETLLDGLNLARFIDDNGDVDRDKVAAFVDGIAPKTDTAPAGFPDLGQGTRSTQQMALNGDPLEQTLKQKLGIR